jgi:hypothetical protein
MSRRIGNALIGAVIAVAVWVFWSFIRHAALEGSLIFENIGHAIPAALLGAIAGYFITRSTPNEVSEIEAPHAPERTYSIDTPLMPDPDDQPFRQH